MAAASVPGWRSRDLEVLATVADTFVRGVDGPDIARRAATTLTLSVDPSQVRDLRFVLRAFDSRAANLALVGRPVRFGDLDRLGREQYLASWGCSAIPQRRAAFSAWRKLLTSLACSVPGSPASTRLWAALAYQRDDPPVTLDPTPIVPYRLPSATADDGAATVMEADAVVVGSGAGGGVVAADLARAGMSVVVLEAGPFVAEPDMPRDELTAFERLYLASGLSATWDGSFTLVAASAVGGGTLVNWMTTLAATESVRSSWAEEHGLDGCVGAAWDADAARLREELGVTRTDVLPPKDRAIVRGAEALGWRASITERDGSGCGDCGSCGFGCVRGTKRSGIRVHLASAWEAGARIVPDAAVRRVIIEAGRATGVEAVVGLAAWRRARVEGTPGAERPRRLIVRASTVALAAGALRTPVVLARSGFDHGAIGRNLRVHPVPIVLASFGDRVDMWRGPMQAARVDEFVTGGPEHTGYVIESAPGHPGLSAVAIPWSSAAAFDRIATTLDRVAPLIAITRDGGAGTVRRTRQGGVRIDYRLDAAGRATIRHALVSMATLARAAGADGIGVASMPERRLEGSSLADERSFRRYLDGLATIDTAPNRLGLFSAHQMGTVRAGTDRRRHACDPGGRVRDGGRRGDTVPGVYVADGSLFPTAIGVNPMLTIMAIARGVGRAILSDRR
jgi:choline dehydrogenase-like flavoprotein